MYVIRLSFIIDTKNLSDPIYDSSHRQLFRIIITLRFH